MLKLNPGATTRISRDGAPDLAGRVRLVSPEINRSTQLGHVRITLAGDPSLKIGMFARASIDARRSCGIAVPRAALDRLTVQVVKGNVVERRKVKVGLYSGSASRPRVLRAQCLIANPRAGAWSRCASAAVHVTSGRSYWLAILQPSGTKGRLRYRERKTARATGASLALSIEALMENGTPSRIDVVTAIASTTGIEYVKRRFPDAAIWTGDIDEELTARGYIVPGLGDAGDLSYGSKRQS